MLIINKRQLIAFSEKAALAYRGRLGGHLASVYPDGVATEPDLDAFADFAVTRSAELGLVSQRDVASFAHALLLLGRDLPDNGQYPWARAILADGRPNKGTRLHECARIELDFEVDQEPKEE